MEKVRLYEMGPYKSYNPGFRSFYFVPFSEEADSVNDAENKDGFGKVINGRPNCFRDAGILTVMNNPSALINKGSFVFVVE